MSRGDNMQQLDLFEQTLEQKIIRLEKWMTRLQKEMWWLKSIHSLKKNGGEKITPSEQFDLFQASERIS
jgi:hypothetical protein